MKFRILFAFVLLILVVAVALLALYFTEKASATSEARIVPPDWRNGETYTFAIYRPAVGRIATAYYRFNIGEYEGRPVYKINYNALSENLTEASTTVVDAVTLEPYKTARKYKTEKGVSYVDVSYGQGKIVVRRKSGEEGEIRETIIDFPGRIFDYDEVMWLIQQLDFSNDDRLHFALFSTVGDQTILVVVRNMGKSSFEFSGKKFQATRYSFNLNLVSQEVWIGEIDGKKTVVKYDTGENTFYNLALLKGTKVEETKQSASEEKTKEEEKVEEKPKEPAPPGEGKVYF